MGCANQYDFCLIRGDSFSLDVALTKAYSEVYENPNDWVANLVFREHQDDDLIPYLTLTAVPEVDPDPLPDEPPISIRFSAPPADTEALPDWDIVAFCEIVRAAPDGAVHRLFNSDVGVSD